MAIYDVSTTEKKASPSLVAGGTLYADSPIGTILPYGGATAPNGWFLAQGQAISRTDYSELFAVIGTAFGSGDGSTTFNLPDMRESVPKGAGLTGHTVGAHLDADGLAVGEFLDDRIQNITGSFSVRSSSSSDGNTTSNGSGAFTLSDMTATADRLDVQNGSYKVNKINLDASSVARTGATTEVKSVGVNYIIKAKMTAVPADFLAKVDEAVEESIAPRTIYCAALIENTDLSEVRTTTATRNGFFIVNIEKSSGAAGNTVRLKVNNKYAQWVPFWGTNYGTTLCAFVRNGDEIEISADGAGSEFKIASAIIQEISWT